MLLDRAEHPLALAQPAVGVHQHQAEAGRRSSKVQTPTGTSTRHPAVGHGRRDRAPSTWPAAVWCSRSRAAVPVPRVVPEVEVTDVSSLGSTMSEQAVLVTGAYAVGDDVGLGQRRDLRREPASELILSGSTPALPQSSRYSAEWSHAQCTRSMTAASWRAWISSLDARSSRAQYLKLSAMSAPSSRTTTFANHPKRAQRTSVTLHRKVICCTLYSKTI